MIKRLSGLLLLLGGILLVTLAYSCSERAVTDKPSLAVSILPQKYILDEIVGDRMKVVSLLGKGGDPETYDPSMSHLMSMEKSLAYFRVGPIGFEEAISQRIRKSCPDLAVIDTSRGIELMRGTHGGGDVADPHVWTSIVNLRIMAGNMLAALDSLDAKNSDYYHSNYNRLISRLDSVDREIKIDLAVAPQKSFVVWHPSLSYFARDYNLRQVALGAEHKELSPAEMKARIDSAATSGASIMVVQEGVDSRSGETARQELGLRAVNVNFLDYDLPATLLSVSRALSRPSGAGAANAE